METNRGCKQLGQVQARVQVEVWPAAPPARSGCLSRPDDTSAERKREQKS